MFKRSFLLCKMIHFLDFVDLLGEGLSRGSSVTTVNNIGGIRYYFRTRFWQVEVQSVHSLSPGCPPRLPPPITKALPWSVRPKTCLVLFRFGHRYSCLCTFLAWAISPSSASLLCTNSNFTSVLTPSPTTPELNFFLFLDPRKWSMPFMVLWFLWFSYFLSKSIASQAHYKILISKDSGPFIVLTHHLNSISLYLIWLMDSSVSQF